MTSAIYEPMVIGSDPENYLAKIQTYEAAGFDHVYLQQMSPDQEGFFQFCERKIPPKRR